MYTYQFLFRQIRFKNLFFLCNTDPHHLVSSFITALEGLATQNKAQMKLKYNEVETAIKIKLYGLLEELTQRRKRADRLFNFVEVCSVESEEQDLSTQFQLMLKNQLFDLREHFERCQSLGSTAKRMIRFCSSPIFYRLL